MAREEAARTTVEPVYEQPSSSNHVAEEVIRPRQTERVNERFNDRGTTLRYEDLIARCTHPEWKADSTLRASLAGEGGRVVGERFRTLRSRLYQIAGMRTLRRLLITSSMQGEGKTFIATNLVRSIIRQSDKRVLLVRCRPARTALAHCARRTEHAWTFRLSARRSRRISHRAK